MSQSRCGAEVAAAPERVQQWHKLTLDFAGPESSESATPNPFTDYRLDVTFTNNGKSVVVPGYYAADGDAANSSSDSGNVWRVNFAPNRAGDWSWKASFREGEGVAVAESSDAGASAGMFDGESGSFQVTASDKAAPDLRSMGRLEAVGTRYPHTMGDDRVFLKAGADAPENFLAYADFDGDFKSDGKKDNLVKTWEPHVRDWQQGDPLWADGRGKGIIGAVNYLASKGMNAVSFLTMNINGDDRNVFPYTSYNERLRLDVSRLAQWQIVLDHASKKGLFLHFKTQETENETLLDKGDVGPQRRLYYRELIARFGYLPALNWNLGEENGAWNMEHKKNRFQSTEQRLAMAQFFEDHDPYNHPIVIHNGQWYDDLYGPDSALDGASLQTNQSDFRNVHKSTLKILRGSAKKGKQWIVACDEPGDAQHSLLPDAEDPQHNDARVNALWGNLLAGGWGIEWYFGYAHPHSDLTCQDYRSRERMWEQSAHALHFFRQNDLPVESMNSADELISGSGAFCLAEPGEVYAAILRDPSQQAAINLAEHDARYRVGWFDPRKGGDLQEGSVATISGTGKQQLGLPPSEHDRDWVVLVRREQ